MSLRHNKPYCNHNPLNELKLSSGKHFQGCWFLRVTTQWNIKASLAEFGHQAHYLKAQETAVRVDPWREHGPHTTSRPDDLSGVGGVRTSSRSCPIGEIETWSCPEVATEFRTLGWASTVGLGTTEMDCLPLALGLLPIGCISPKLNASLKYMLVLDLLGKLDT